MKRPDPLDPPRTESWRIEDILRLARRGELLVPVFQRNFVWDRQDIIALFDSLYRGYPIGSFLIWETVPPPGAQAHFGPLHFEPAVGNAQVVIDGQQRITSLVAACLGGGRKEPKFNLSFDLEWNAVVAPSRADDASRTLLPLDRVFDTQHYLEWLQSNTLAFDRELIHQADMVVRALRDYRIPVSVIHSRDETIVREIFLRLNRTTKSLRESEIFAALHHGVGSGADLHSMGERLAELNFGLLDNEWLLRALGAVRDEPNIKYLSYAWPTEALHGDAERTYEALARVVRFLREEAHVPFWDLMPYKFPLLPLAKLFDRYPEPSRTAMRALRAWLWRGAATGYHNDTRPFMVKTALLCISDDAEESASALLKTLPAPATRFEMRPHDFRAAATKLVCGVLARKGPRDLQDGSRLDVLALMRDGEDSAANAWLPIVPTKAIKGKTGTENRLLHPKVHGHIRRAMEQADADVLESHFVSSEAIAALRAGSFDQFLTLRRERIELEVRTFLDEMGA